MQFTDWVIRALIGKAERFSLKDFSVFHSIWIDFKWQNYTLKCLLSWKFSRQMGIRVQISTNRTGYWKNFYLSVSHYNTVKKHWPALASSFGKFFSEFISASSLSLKICEKKRNTLSWAERKQESCDHYSFPLKPSVVAARGGFCRLCVFVQSRKSFVGFLFPWLNSDCIDIARNTFNTSDIHLLLADFGPKVQKLLKLLRSFLKVRPR